MKNKNLLLGLIAVAIGVLLFGCYLLFSNSDTKYAEVIPSDALVVCKSDVVALLEKSEIKDSKLKKLIEGDMPSAIKKHMDNPKEFGMDLRKPVYIFYSGNYIGVVINTYDKDDFMNFVKELDKSKDDQQHFTEKNGVAITSDHKTAIAVNDRSILILQKKYAWKDGNVQEKAEELFNLSDDQKFRSSEDFAKLEDEDGDISAIVNMHNALKEEKQMGLLGGLLGNQLPEGVDIRTIRFVLNGESKKGEIDLRLTVYSSDKKTSDYLNENDLNEIDGDYFNLLDKDGILLGAFNTDGENAKKAWDEDIVKELELLGSNKKTLFKYLGEAIEKIDGDVTIAVNPRPDTDKFAYVNAACRTSKDMTDALTNLRKAINETNSYSDEEIIKKEGKHFLFEGDKETTFKFGAYDKKNFYLTSTSDESKLFDGDITNSGLKEIKGYAKDCYGFLYWDIKNTIDNYGDKIGKEGKLYMKPLKYATLAITSGNQAELRIFFNNEKENALKAIVEEMESIL